MKQVIAFILSIGGFTFFLCVVSILTKVLTESIYYRAGKGLKFIEKVWNFFIICLIITVWFIFAVLIGKFINYCLAWV